MKNKIITLTALAVVLSTPAIYGQEGKPKSPNPMGADKDNDGFVSKEEFMATPGAMKDLEKAAKRFTRLDKNSDGKISPEEFKAGAPKPKPVEGEKPKSE